MKNKFVYFTLRLLVLITRNKFIMFKEPLKKFNYLVNLERYQAKGATIGSKTILINCTLSNSTKGDKFFIGDNCTLTGTTLLAHDASPSLFIDELVLKEQPYMTGSRLSYRDPIHIGDNVFIGWGSIVLPGVTIGDNVVIGAGSVVTKDIPSGVVAAGNPIKIIKPIDEYITSYRNKIKQYPERF
jgi:acetyltransferase-like isoleucine patch superfamily enzyme